MTSSLFISKQSGWLLILIMMLLISVATVQAQVTPEASPQVNTERTRGRGPNRQQVIVTEAVESFTSQPVRSLPPSLLEFDRTLTEQPEPRLDPERARGRERGEPDRALQSSLVTRATIQNGLNFMGIRGGGLPPDPTGAVGQTQYVQAVNSSFAIFDKTDGHLIQGPVSISSLWNGVNSPCARHNAGDPVVQYDRIANRWLISQFLLSEEFGECIAVSTSPDATGTYNLYRFSYPSFPDYPKIAVWPDAYYVSYNMFDGPPNGARACALEREKMLSGARDARQVCFQLEVYNILPSDFDGGDMPPAGTPNYFLRRVADGKSLSFRRFHVDWTNTSNSTFGAGQTNEPDAIIPVAPFNDSCGGGTCIPQPNGYALESLGERLMFRVAYRRFADHEALVANHSVEPTNAARGGVRWYEIRNLTTTPTVFQQGTFVPDIRSRWMGSVAMDSAGNIAAGYSVSSPDTPPGIYVAARGPSDPLGTLGSETLIVAGESQSAFRWGDYSQLNIDPVDNCTLWFTAEYVSGGIRSTRIASFRVNNCSSRTRRR